mmetsp:Transcript_56174/g.77412  ORF Transcript_56174/g.77412 Transcript_56174/m.77412 type:complete len:84 (-) Transcript_56174:973-1224(-)
MLVATEGSVIRSIISGFNPGGLYLDSWQMFALILVWYFFTITTYGVWVPAGLFLPGIIIGCGIGSLYETIRGHIFGIDTVNLS